MRLDQFEKRSHCGRYPLIFVPERVCGYVQGRACPMKCLELILAKLTRDDDGRQESEYHSCADTLLHRFHA